MIWDTIWFTIFPYITLATAIAVTIYRGIYRPFSVSSAIESTPFAPSIKWLGASICVPVRRPLARRKMRKQM